MSYEKVKEAKSLVVGTKQTKKAIDQGRVIEVIIADDAEARIKEPVLAMCKERGIPVTHVDSMKELGKACKIDVGAAMVAIVREE